MNDESAAIPPDIVEDVMQTARETLRAAAAGDVKQDREAAVRRMALAFSELSVTTDTLTHYLGHGLGTITPEELADLRGVYKSIAGGHTDRQEHFVVATEGPKTGPPPKPNGAANDTPSEAAKPDHQYIVRLRNDIRQLHRELGGEVSAPVLVDAGLSGLSEIDRVEDTRRLASIIDGLQTAKLRKVAAEKKTASARPTAAPAAPSDDPF